MGRILPFLPVAALVALGVLFATYGLHHDPQVQPNALIGKPLPVAAFPPLEGGGPAMTVAPLLNGKPGLVNVWFSYCAPCIVESPQLMRLKQAGVNIVGVTWMDEPGNSAAFLDRYGNPFSKVLVGGDQSSIEFGITAAPETFIVDSKGMIVDKHVGIITDEDVPHLVAKLKSLG
jgi:cytochrome c biogenesis protein CcmG, thiol:disulfide interchange protein DsbE